jgi:hypothetical protein
MSGRFGIKLPVSQSIRFFLLYDFGISKYAVNIRLILLSVAVSCERVIEAHAARLMRCS